MTDHTVPTAARPERVLHLPPQARPVHRDDGAGYATDPSAGIEPANCGNLTGMARDLCYAQVHGIYY